MVIILILTGEIPSIPVGITHHMGMVLVTEAFLTHMDTIIRTPGILIIVTECMEAITEAFILVSMVVVIMAVTMAAGYLADMVIILSMVMEEDHIITKEEIQSLMAEENNPATFHQAGTGVCLHRVLQEEMDL